MEKFEITSSTLNSNYTYSNDTLVVDGNYAKDATTSTLQNISGTCYAKNEDGDKGVYVGNFTGYNRDGEIRYSLSEMSYAQSEQVWQAINAIESHITGKEEA